MDAPGVATIAESLRKRDAARLSRPLFGWPFPTSKGQ